MLRILYSSFFKIQKNLRFTEPFTFKHTHFNEKKMNQKILNKHKKLPYLYTYYRLCILDNENYYKRSTPKILGRKSRL